MSNLKKLLKDCNSFAILTHERPDGDAIASSLAMYWCLMKEKSETEDVVIDIIIPEFSRKFSFLPGFEKIKTEPSNNHYDMLIVVDVSEPYRIKVFDSVVSRCSETICFDHHEGFNLNNCVYTAIDPSAPSTTTILYKLFGSNVGSEFLECVLTGILSDTQNLTLNTSEAAPATVKELSLIGLDIDKFKVLISQKDPRTVELTNLALDRIDKTKHSGNTVIYSYIAQEDLLKEEQSLSIVDHKQIIKDILEKEKTDVLILAIENDHKEWKFSMRAFIPLDLNELCQKLVEVDGLHFLKGGGHSYSAGLTATGNYEDILHSLYLQLDAALASLA